MVFLFHSASLQVHPGDERQYPHALTLYHCHQMRYLCRSSSTVAVHRPNCISFPLVGEVEYSCYTSFTDEDTRPAPISLGKCGKAPAHLTSPSYPTAPSSSTAGMNEPLLLGRCRSTLKDTHSE